MSQLESLNSQDHGHLRLRQRSGVEPHFVQIVPLEFTAAAVCCPILFTKDAASGAFYAGALLGFKPAEGALTNIADRGGFEPLNLQRDGFLISGEQIVIDRDNPRFSDTEGEPLFDEARQPSVSLRKIQRVLGRLHEGTVQSDAFIRNLMQLRLIEPIDISMSFDDGERLTLQGLYTVSKDRLREIDDAAVVRLFRSGDLQLAYTMAGSLNQLGILAQLRNRRMTNR